MRRHYFLSPWCSTMTMEELLVSMTRKARLECEEAHRQLNAAVNGLAGLHLIQQQVGKPLTYYTSTIASLFLTL